MQPYSFALEHLEDRALFSVAAPLDTTDTVFTTRLAMAQATVASHPLKGAFNASGKYTHSVGPIGNPDAGSHYDFNGSGRKPSLGKFTLTGQVTTPGFIANGRASGQLVITTSHGTITLSVQGPPQTPGSLPPTLTFKILRGTGKFANSRGKGGITLSASDRTKRFVFRFNPAS
jgi:hypothetical protein